MSHHADCDGWRSDLTDEQVVPAGEGFVLNDIYGKRLPGFWGTRGQAEAVARRLALTVRCDGRCVSVLRMIGKEE